MAAAGGNMELKLVITADGKAAVTELNGVAAAEGAIGTQANDAGDQAKHLGDQAEQGAKQAADAYDQLSTALKSIAFAALVQEFIQVTGAVESQQKALASLTGSEQAAAEARQYLLATSDRLGLSTMDLGQQYIALLAATKGTALEGQATKDIFEAVAGSMAKLGKTSAETGNALNAISQMASKGVVAAEEMRGQLGEALPGAMQRLSDATGLSTAQLNQMMESGQLMASDMIPALAKGLEDLAGKNERMEGLTAAWTRLQNALSRSLSDPGQAGLGNALSGILDGLGKSIEVVTAGFVEVGRDIGAVGAYASGAIPSLSALGDALYQNAVEAAKQAGLLPQVAAAQASVTAAAQAAAQAQQAAAAASLRAAAAYVQTNQDATALVTATQAQNAAAIQAAQTHREQIALLGDEAATLRATADLAQVKATASAQESAATAALAQVTRERIATLTAELTALQARGTAGGMTTEALANETKTRQAAIDKLQETLTLQEANTQKLNGQAAAEAVATQAAQLAAATYGDQSAQVQALSDRRADLVASIQREGAASAAAQPMLAQLSLVSRQLADAAQDAAKRQDEQVAAIQRGLTLTATKAGVEQAELTRLRDLATARGDLTAAQDYGIRIARSEIAQAQAAADAQQAQAAALAEKARLLEVAAQATGGYTSEEQAQVAVARDAATMADLEAQKLGIATQAKRDALSAAQALAEREQALGQAMSEAGVTGVKSMADVQTAISQAATSGEIAALGDALQAAFDRGAISADELQQSIDDLKAKADEVEEKSAKVGESFAVSFQGAAAAMGEQVAALGTYGGEAEAIFNRLSNAAVGAFNATVQFGGDISHWNEHIAETAIRAAQGAQEVDRLTAALQSGGATADELGAAMAMASQGVVNLDDARLDGLRSAIASAKQEMDSFAESAREGLMSLKEEWADLNDNQAEVERLKYEERSLALEQQIAEARNTGNSEALESLGQQRSLIDQIYQKKVQDAQAEAQAKDEQARQAQAAQAAQTAQAAQQQAQAAPAQAAQAQAAQTQAAQPAAPPAAQTQTQTTRTVHVNLTLAGQSVPLDLPEGQADRLLAALQEAQQRAA